MTIRALLGLVTLSCDYQALSLPSSGLEPSVGPESLPRKVPKSRANAHARSYFVFVFANTRPIFLSLSCVCVWERLDLIYLLNNRIKQFPKLLQFNRNLSYNASIISYDTQSLAKYS